MEFAFKCPLQKGMMTPVHMMKRVKLLHDVQEFIIHSHR